MQSNNSKGYTCPTCIEKNNMMGKINFCAAGKCFCCKQQIPYSSHTYCKICSIEKCACYECGLNIVEGNESIKKIEDFFRLLWSDDEMFMVCQDEEFLEDLNEEEFQKAKQERLDNFMKDVKVKYDNKTKEEVIEMIGKYF